MSRRNLRASARFAEELKALADGHRLSDALTGLFCCIERNAESFEQIGVAPVRVYVAKTLPFSELPAYRVVFWIVDDSNVQLESIAIIPDEWADEEVARGPVVDRT